MGKERFDGLKASVASCDDACQSCQRLINGLICDLKTEIDALAAAGVQKDKLEGLYGVLQDLQDAKMDLCNAVAAGVTSEEHEEEHEDPVTKEKTKVKVKRNRDK